MAKIGSVCLKTVAQCLCSPRLPVQAHCLPVTRPQWPRSTGTYCTNWTYSTNSKYSPLSHKWVSVPSLWLCTPGILRPLEKNLRIINCQMVQMAAICRPKLIWILYLGMYLSTCIPGPWATSPWSLETRPALYQSAHNQPGQDQTFKNTKKMWFKKDVWIICVSYSPFEIKDSPPKCIWYVN